MLVGIRAHGGVIPNSVADRLQAAGVNARHIEGDFGAYKAAGGEDCKGMKRVRNAPPGPKE